VRRSRFLVLLSFASVCAAVAPPQGPAYRFHAYKWPNGIVRYYNAATDQRWAVARAVGAWNHSGAHVRFIAVPRRSADMVIREQANGIYCNEGRASVGYVKDAHVVIFPAHGVTHACNRYWAARVMAHELGHVLGLLHEDRYCATMNATGSMHGGAECPGVLSEWRCRLLELDDVAGVAKVYGGTPRAPTNPELCPLYPAVKAPLHLTADYDPRSRAVALSFTRPAEASIPNFIPPSPWNGRPTFALSDTATDCSAAGSPDVSRASRWTWHVRPGGLEIVHLRLTHAPTCYAVWALDKLGRPSATPARVSVTLAP
jgi:hypothetical protein